MAKAAVIYYSLDGNTRFVASEICRATGAQSIEITRNKKLPGLPIVKHFVGGMEVKLKKSPPVTPLLMDLSPYETLYVGAPVWASSFASPLRTFLAANGFKGKKIHLFCCYAGNPGTALSDMKAMFIRSEFGGELSIRKALENRDAVTTQITSWVSSLS